MNILAAVPTASPGTDVQSGSLLLAVPIALVAGLLSFLSPCVLSLVPGYLSYLTGMSAVELRAEQSRVGGPGAGSATITNAHHSARVLTGSVLFVLGLAAVFVCLGAAFGSLGDLLRLYQDLLTRVFGALTILLGLAFAGAFGRRPPTVAPAWHSSTASAWASRSSSPGWPSTGPCPRSPWSNGTTGL